MRHFHLALIAMSAIGVSRDAAANTILYKHYETPASGGPPSSFVEKGFGAGYEVQAGLSVELPRTSGGNTLRAWGSLSAWGEVFGDKHTLAALHGQGNVTLGGGHSYSIDVYTWMPLFGYTQIYGASFSSAVGVSKSWSTTFIAAEQTFWWGPVPITVS